MYGVEIIGASVAQVVGAALLLVVVVACIVGIVLLFKNDEVGWGIASLFIAPLGLYGIYLELEKRTETKPKGLNEYFVNLITCLLFPFMALWYGPRYLSDKEYAKGAVIIVLVAAELIFVFSIVNSN